MALCIALTGATGFIGQHVHAMLVARGYQVQALTRRPQATMPNTRWILGDFSQPAALEALVAGTQGVIHLAGVIKGRRWLDFQRGNVDATQALIQALQRAGVHRLVHASTLAARVPDISLYARSKAQAEAVVQASSLAWTIVRLPAIYGPGDKETLAFFKAAHGLVLPLSNPEGRVSLLHVQDAASALLAAFEPATVGQNLEIGDGGGVRIAALACAIQQAVDGKARRLAVPRWLAASLAWANLAFSFITRTHPMLTPAKVRELYHPDWSVNDARLAALTGWQPQVPLREGLLETAAWYRRQGWL